MEPHIYTFTGRRVNPLDLRPADICIEDIAHALACINRFVGHTREPISVAQHSLNVSALAAPEAALQGLLHDASEAYLGDVTKWVKAAPAMAAYREAEDRAQAAIYDRFGCPRDLHARVEWADRVMVRFEGQRGFCDHWRVADGSHPDYPPLTDEEIELVGRWRPLGWPEAERLFLEMFVILAAGAHCA